MYVCVGSHVHIEMRWACHQTYSKYMTETDPIMLE